MAYRLTSKPLALALSLADAKEALKITDASQDAQVTAWVAGVVAHAEHLTGRAFVSQGWRLTLDAFPASFVLEHPTLISVASVKYQDINNVQQTVSPSDYIVDTESSPGRIVLAPDKSWPATASRINAVQVDFTAGYGVDDSFIPPDVKLYLIAKLREQYDPAIKAEQGTVQSSYLDRLLDREEVYG